MLFPCGRIVSSWYRAIHQGKARASWVSCKDRAQGKMRDRCVNGEKVFRAVERTSPQKIHTDKFRPPQIVYIIYIIIR